MSDQSVRLRPESLPAKIDEWKRYNKVERTLNDYVEDIHRGLWDANEEYQKYLEAVYDEDAVEGSCSADNIMAAQMIRDKASGIDGSPVSNKKLATISKALGVVLRRYHADRRRRKNTVGGEYVSPDSNATNGSSVSE